MATVRKRKWKSAGKEREAWVVDYTVGAQRILKTFDTRKEAEAWKVNALHEVQLGTHTPASASKTVTEAWLLWLEQGEADGLEFGTTLARKQHLKVHVEPSVGHLRLSDLTTPLLYDFDKKLRDKGTSIAMRRKILTSVKTMLSFAQGRGLVAQNVARGGVTNSGVCLLERRIGNADITLRFPRDWLTDWQNVASAIDHLIARLHPN